MRNMRLFGKKRLCLTLGVTISVYVIIFFIAPISKPSKKPFVFVRYAELQINSNIVPVYNTSSQNGSSFSAKVPARGCPRFIPCTVWMLWDKGWDKAPPLQATCLRSWRRHNPNYNIRALNMKEAEGLINRTHYYSDDAWNSAPIQAKSDIIRVELLARYGGVWADATVYCNEPLDNWIDIVLQPTNFFVYERKNLKKRIRPWIASWFIASSHTSRILNIWLEYMRKGWSQPPYANQVGGYFWVHRIFAKLVNTNEEFQKEFNNVTYLDAAGPLCSINDNLPELRDVLPHVYKAKAGPCANTRKQLKANDAKLLAAKKAKKQK